MSRRSERKRQEEEARRRKELMRRQMIMQQRMMMQQQPANQLCYGPMSNTNAAPSAMPSRFIQLTPIVQPIAMVPYSTQNQPIMMYGDQGGMGGPDMSAVFNSFGNYGAPTGGDEYI